MARNLVGENKWRVSASVRVRGQKHPVSKQRTVLGSEAVAVATEYILKRELLSRSLTGGTTVSTFGDAVDVYIERQVERGRYSAKYGKMVEQLKIQLGGVMLDDFETCFQEWREKMKETPTAQGKPRQSASVNRYTTIARAVLGHLVRLKILDENPITTYKFPPLPETPRNRHLTQNEQERLRDAIRTHCPHILPIVEYMMQIPCRSGELLGLEHDRYDPYRKTIFIPNSKARIPIHKPVPPGMVDYFDNIPAECEWLFYYHMAATNLVLAGNPEQVVMKIAGWKTNMLDRYFHDDSLFSAQRVVFSEN